VQEHLALPPYHSGPGEDRMRPALHSHNCRPPFRLCLTGAMGQRAPLQPWPQLLTVRNNDNKHLFTRLNNVIFAVNIASENNAQQHQRPLALVGSSYSQIDASVSTPISLSSDTTETVLHRRDRGECLTPHRLPPKDGRRMAEEAATRLRMCLT
jgi:hypothetical protein